MQKRLKKIFFNYATVGPINKAAHRAVSDFLNEYLHVGPPEVVEKYDKYFEKLSKELAKLLHCSPQEVAYTKNTTEGLIIASEALPLKKGDQVLLLANEYPAVLLSWLKKKKNGIDVKFIEDENNEKAFKKLTKSISKKTKAVVISWGQYYDGYIPDIALLSELCSKVNAFLVVDGVHLVGSREINLKKIHIDILCCGGQKQIGSLPGSGFIYINKNTIDKLQDFKVGIRSITSFDHNGYQVKDSAWRFADGTQNILGIVALHAAIQNINTTGIKNIQAKNIQLLKKFKHILKKNNISFINYKNQTNTIALEVSDPTGLAQFLRKNSVYIKAVKDIARVSFCYESQEEDFKTMVKLIKQWLYTKEKSYHYFKKESKEYSHQ